MVTLKDVAKKARVSVATVSYVLNGNHHQVSTGTIEKVMSVVDELNYKPNNIAKSLRTSKTKIIGIIAEDLTVFNTPKIIDGIGEFFEQHGYNLVLNNLRLSNRIGIHYEDAVKYKSRIKELIDNLVSRETDGLIYLGVHFRDIEGIVTKIEKPVVYTYCFMGDHKSGWVNYKEEEASYNVMEYLINLGHRSIGIITGVEESISTQKRLKGCLNSIDKHSDVIGRDSVFIHGGDWTYESGYSAAMELLKNESPLSAVFAMSDPMAIGVMDAARDSGLQVPRDISVIGFDNQACSQYSYPKLTTVEIPLKEMGRKSAQLLLNLIEEKKSGVDLNIELDCQLIERESVRSR